MMAAVLTRLDKGIAPRMLPSTGTDIARTQAAVTPPR
jgi:hypothetical protein